VNSDVPCAIEATVRHQRGALGLDLDLAVDHGEVLAVVGPNGAGKTTLLRILAGLDRLDSGVVRLSGTTVDQPESKVFLDPADRSVGMVFQSRALFAGMSALDNVAFGPRCRGATRTDANDVARQWLDAMDVAAIADLRPRALSGGEAQRVALARALAVEPEVLLLDEPMTAVDAGARPALRELLRRHLDGFRGGCVIVTHDPSDIRRIADRVAVLENGTIAQVGTPDEILSRPDCAYARALAHEETGR